MAGISITLAGNFTKLDELKDKAQKTATGIKSAFGSNIGKAMFAGVAAAGTAAFAAVVVGIKSAIEAGAELDDMVQRTGASGEKLFVLSRAFELAGLSGAQVPQVLNRMQKALAGVNEEGEPTNKAFAKLGLSIADLMAMDPAEALRVTAEAIASIEDPAKRTTAAMEIFGKAGGELLVLFNQPSLFGDAERQVGELGETLAGNAGEFGTVSDAMEVAELKMQQVGAVVAVELLPQLLKLSEWMNNTDFSDVGGGIAILVEKTMEWGSALAEVSQYLPGMIVFNKLADMTIGGDLTEEEKAAIKAEADAYVPEVNPDSVQGKAAAAKKAEAAANEAAAASEAAEREKSTAEAEKSAVAAEAKAAAERKAAEEKERQRAAAAEEYKLERDILAARLKGDDERLAKLEREKAIREEMRRLEGAGFSAEEARKPAEEKVDLARDAERRAKERETAADEKRAKRENLEGMIAGKRNDLENLRYESSVGSISSMQRIGGGGGAVSSGLDYQRQTTDLQRELNGLMRQLIDLNRGELDP